LGAAFGCGVLTRHSKRMTLMRHIKRFALMGRHIVDCRENDPGHETRKNQKLKNGLVQKIKMV
jgi:hypothetical protein